MESLLSTSSVYLYHPNVSKLFSGHGSSVIVNRRSSLLFINGYHSPSPSASPHKLSHKLRKSLIVAAKKDDDNSFIPSPDESLVFFPEAMLLRERKVREDGRVLPDFADEEEKYFEDLNLKRESDLNVERMRHYEVVYLVHEKYEEEVGIVNEKIQDFIIEKKGKIWRQSDWGLRNLEYKIQKAMKAHYILMNIELDAKWINDFKSMLDEEERVIRHLVIKKEEAETEECPPPPELHTLRADMVEEEDSDYDEEDDDWEDNDEDEEEMDGEDEEEMDMDGDDEDGVTVIDSNYDDEEDRSIKSDTVSDKEVLELRR